MSSDKLKEKAKIYLIDEKLKEDIKQILLNNEKSKKQRLGQGVIKKDDEEIFYYGTSIELNDRQINAAILDNQHKQILVNYKMAFSPKDKNYAEYKDELKEFGINYRTSFDDDAISYQWSNKAISEYLYNNLEPRNISDIIKDINYFFETYCKFEIKNETLFHSCVVAETYFFILFDYQPRIEFRGLTSSGKTTASKLYKQFCFNPIWLTKNTDSSRYRDVEATAGTIIVDNYDTLGKEVKEAMQFFIETTFEAENGAYRLSIKAGDNYKTTTLDAYCPMVYNSITGLGSDATKNRTFTTVMQKHKGVPKINMKDQRFVNLRNELRLYALHNWKTVKDTYDTLFEKQLDNRNEDISKPILTIAKLCGEDTYQKVLQVVLDKTKAVEEDEGNESFERVVMFILLEDFGEEAEKRFKVSAVAEKFIEQHWGYDREQDRSKFISKRTYAGKIVKAAIKSIPNANLPGRVTNPKNQCHIELKRNELLNFMFSRGFLKEELDNSSKSEKTLTYNNNTNNINNINNTNPNQHENAYKQVNDVNVVNVVNVFSKDDNKSYLEKNDEIEEVVVKKEDYDFEGGVFDE